LSYRELFLTSPLLTYRVKGVPPVVYVLGVPFDSTSTYRLGSRFGPNVIRDALLNIEVYSKRLDVDLERLTVEDLGNLSQTGDVNRMLDSLSKVVSELLSNGRTPAVLGGEHTLTYGVVGVLPDDVAVVVFDAHADMRDEFADLRLGHTTWLRRLIEERGGRDVVHIGLRAATRQEWSYIEDVGLSSIPTDVILAEERPEEALKSFLKRFRDVYVSVDMDVLDPAYAPGVGNPEAAGISTHQLLEFIYALRGMNIVGFDIVEVCPPYDNGAAAVAASRLFAELVCLTYLSRRRS